jgi:hypothetical protein
MNGKVAAYDQPCGHPDPGQTGASFIYILATEGDEAHRAVGLLDDASSVN